MDGRNKDIEHTWKYYRESGRIGNEGKKSIMLSMQSQEDYLYNWIKLAKPSRKSVSLFLAGAFKSTLKNNVGNFTFSQLAM